LNNQKCIVDLDYITKEILAGQSIKEIAFQQKICTNTIQKYIKQLGLIYKQTQWQKMLSDDQLIEYLNSGLTCQEIADKVESSLYSIERHKRELDHQVSISTTELQLLKEAIALGYRTTEIAILLGSTAKRISKMIKKYAVPFTPYAGCKQETVIQKGHVITPRQRSIIIGTLLGDGHLTVRNKSKSDEPRKSTTSHLIVNHSDAQKDYLEWIHQELIPLSKPLRCTISKGYSTMRKTDPKESIFWSYATVSHTELYSLHELFYQGRIRKVAKNIEELLDPLALAVWYMDDGSTRGSESLIHTQGFTILDVVRLISALHYKFGIDAELLNATSSVYDQTAIYPIIRMRGDSQIKFHTLIDTYIHNCLSYKRLTIPTLSHECLMAECHLGLTDKEIAQKYNLKPLEVQRDRKLLGLSRKRFDGFTIFHTKEEIERILMNSRTMSIAAKTLHTTMKTLRLCCIELGVDTSCTAELYKS